jgi:hypothetical protein
MSAKLLVTFSDIHCGSTVALSHPEAKQTSGNVIGHGSNLLHAWLWENWLATIAKVGEYCGGDEAIICANGDLVEGNHHRTHEITALSVEEHANNAILCLEPWKSIASRWIITEGTECHTQRIEHYIAGQLDTKAKAKWLWEQNGCLIDAAHHISATSRAYLEASLLSIAMGNARLNYARSSHRVPSIFLRAHRHCHGHYSDGRGMIGIAGAWQFLTRHGQKVVTDAIPAPSVLVHDWRGCAHGELPIVKEFLVTPPQDEIESF